MKRISKLLQLVPAMLALTLSAPALAGEVPKPQVPPAVKGEQCVEDTAVMRRNHMDFLKHHRDESLREGIRTKQYSLTECLECHVAPESQANASQESGEHFCMSCHSYAGVTVDCFQCHNTRPKKTAQFHPLVTPGMQALKDVHQPDTGALLNKFAEAHASKKTGAIQ